MQELETLDASFGGVIETIWAEGEDLGGMGLGDGGDGGGDDLDLGDGGEGDGQGGEGQRQEADGQEGQGDGEGLEKVDGRLFTKEIREALKSLRTTPEGTKVANELVADHHKAQQMLAIDPGGINAIRETYALIQSVGGAEAITSLQERVASADGVDEALAAGDPKALESLGPDFDAGLAKLTPTILDRIMRADPEAYSAAILPHLMSALAGAPITADLNRMVDALQAPHLDDAGKLKALTQLLGRIGQWYDVNEKKAGQLKSAPADKAGEQLATERSKFEEEQQQAHWKNNIQPQAAQYERGKFDELLKPYDVRLKLDAAAKQDLLATFRAKMSEAGKADAAYMKQMAIYRKQRNPDAAVVSNFVKAAINRHSKAVMDGVVKARYGRFLGGSANSGGKKAVVQPGARGAGGNGSGSPIVVSVKPSPDQIDYRKTSEADQWNKIYTLKDGKKVKWVKPA